MQPVLTATEIRFYDMYATDTLKIPSMILMENAGRGVVDSMEKHYGTMKNKHVVVVCGKGNNGGDGFVVARHLLIRGATVTVLLTSPPATLKGDALTNYSALVSLRKTNSRPLQLTLTRFSSTKKLTPLEHTDFIIDALFGTGFNGRISGKFATLIDWINSRTSKRISIDIPSGLHADNGTATGAVVNADLTVTMAHLKTGLLIRKGATLRGKIEVVDIGIPSHIPPIAKVKTFHIERQDIRDILPIRDRQAHKHSVGKLCIIAGSTGLTGAAAMSAESAMKSGAGAVILCVPKSVYTILAKKLTEVMVVPVEDTLEGSLSLAALPLIRKHCAWADIVVIGPGLSRNPETQLVITTLLSETSKPTLLDADGFNAIAAKPGILKHRASEQIILTPHTGEFSRISGITAEEVENNRVETARRFSMYNKLTLVLKGAPTVTASPDGTVWINSNGNPGMATAGSGDVLTGIIAGLWGQSMTMTDAARSGVFIHGKAGDLAQDAFGEKSLLATDIQKYISEAIHQTNSP